MKERLIKFIEKQGYKVNTYAQEIIGICDDWYSNKLIPDFHKRTTVSDVSYELLRLNFAKRCCSDDANLCEVVEVNASKTKNVNDSINKILIENKFDTMYRQQLERTSATGTVACYVRLENANLYQDGYLEGGDIKLNYVNADSFVPLAVVNGEVLEAAFVGESLVNGKNRYTLVIFKLENNKYSAETHVFDHNCKEMDDLGSLIQLGEVKPFAVMRNAEVNNLKDMGAGYGLPKLWNAIPALKILDLAFNILFSDLDKGEKILLVNDLLCARDKNGNPIMTPEQKKLFILMGEKLPEEKDLIFDYSPDIRIEQITKCLETALSLLSTMFGHGTKKYTFENGKIVTATEYAGTKQDSMQELNRQRKEAEQYISDIVKAVEWFSNTFQKTTYNTDEDILINFDDSYVTDKESELERKRNDALAFDIPELLVWYLMDAYHLSESEAAELVEKKKEEEPDEPEED